MLENTLNATNNAYHPMNALPENDFQVLQISHANYGSLPAAPALVEKLHEMLVTQRPETAEWEKAAIWNERLATGQAGGYETLPSLHLSVVGRNLSDPAKAEILGFSYGEYHPDSQTAQSNYNIIRPDVTEAQRAAIQKALTEKQLAALQVAAAEKGLKVKALFEELPKEAPSFMGGQPLNFSPYVTTPWFDYGQTEVNMHAPLKDHVLYARGVEEELTPWHVSAFLDSHYRYNTTHPLTHFTKKDTPAFNPDVATLAEQLAEMEKSQRPIHEPKVVEAQSLGVIAPQPGLAPGAPG